MTLSLPVPRQHKHTRQITFQGYHRDDGLWDIEAELKDTKAQPWNSPDKGILPAGEPVHHMQIRLTLDDDLAVHAVELEMPGTPFGECTGAIPALQGLKGARLSAGWRKAVEGTLGGTLGCTHVRELLVNMGTAAYQTISSEVRRKAEEQPVNFVNGLPKPPPHFGKCLAWAYEGSVMARLKPEYFGKKPKD